MLLVLPEAALYGPLLHTSSLIADTPSLLLLLRRDKLLLAEKRYPQAGDEEGDESVAIPACPKSPLGFKVKGTGNLRFFRTCFGHPRLSGSQAAIALHRRLLVSQMQ